MDHSIDIAEMAKGFLADYGALIPVLVGVSITLLAFGIFIVANSYPSPLRRRLNHLNGISKKNRSSSDQLKILNSGFVFNGEDEPSELQKQFIYAGYRSKKAVSNYYLSKVILAAILSALALATVGFFPQLNTGQSTMYCVAGAALGFIIPGIFLDRKVERRKNEIVNGFPDMLDLLVACSEAGMGLNAALQKVAKEISISHPELAVELDTVNSEIRAGIERVEALKGLSDRTGIDEINGFVSMLRQSIKFGTGIAETLRIYSDEFRDRRLQRAEEQAAKIGTKLIFPLVLCIFPAFFLVAVGPAIIGVMSIFETAVK